MPGTSPMVGPEMLELLAFRAGSDTAELMRIVYLPGGSPFATGIEYAPFRMIAGR
jgi:hypothetical protein